MLFLDADPSQLIGDNVDITTVARYVVGIVFTILSIVSALYFKSLQAKFKKYFTLTEEHQKWIIRAEERITELEDDGKDHEERIRKIEAGGGPTVVR